MDDSPPRFAHNAMATAFEIVIAGETRQYAGQAAAAAFAEIDRIEAELSRFNDASDIARINRLKAGESMRVGILAFQCLRAAKETHAETGGAFDVTVGPLVDYWRERKDTGAEEEIAHLRRRVGMENLELREETEPGGAKAFLVSAKQEGVMIDLGGIGKGFALDQAAIVLRDWGVGSALVHGGQSTALALGAPFGETGWPLGAGGLPGRPAAPKRILLRDRALSSSGIEYQGRHIIDPRTGRPVEGKAAVWATAPTATLADGLSTAFMVMAGRDVEQYCARHPDVGALLAAVSPDGAVRTRSFGPEFEP